MQDIITNNLTVFSVILIVLAILGMVVLIAKRWKIAEPDEALIVTGMKKSANGVSTMEVIIDGGKFIIPFMQKLNRLSLRSQEIQAQIPNAITQDKIPVIVDLVALIRVAGDQNSVRLAAQRYLGQEDRIRTSSQEVLIGSIRAIVGEMSVNEVLGNRKRFEEKVREISSETFEKQGLTIESLTIKDFKDENGYIADLGRPEIARNKSVARIQEAEQEQLSVAAKAEADIKIAQHNKKVQLEKAQIMAETEREQARAAQAGPLATAEAEREVITQQAEATRLRAKLRAAELEITVNKEADAQRYKKVQEAEAAREELELRAQANATARKFDADSAAHATIAAAEADAKSQNVRSAANAKATKEVGTAEADIILAKGIADASAMEKKAEAYSKYGEAAIIEILAAMVPEAIAANAQAYANVNNISVFDGLEGFSKGIASNGTQVQELMKNQFGLDVQGLLSGALGGKIASKVSQNKETNEDSGNVVLSSSQIESLATKYGLIPVESTPQPVIDTEQ